MYNTDTKRRYEQRDTSDSGAIRTDVHVRKVVVVFTAM